ncbi:MAG TPA: hypothetical protein VEA77_00080 [Hyphomicrobium sp.]|nr:hypothetical protein [Hyphomicrobium sp.]
MSTTIFVVGGLQAMLLLAAIASLLFGGADPAGQALGEAWTALAAIAVAVCVIPALILAWNDRLLPLALALSLAALLTFAVLLAYAI